MANTGLIGGYLDNAARQGGYLDAINGTTPESLIDGQMKMHPLLSALGGSATHPVVSIGVGQGEELHALRTVLGTEVPIVGVDLSRAALDRAQQRSELFGLNAKLMAGNASGLPFRNDSLSGVVMSAVLHEVFSYNQPDGVAAYEGAVQEAARTLRPGGVFYLREFAAPAQEGPVRLVPLSEEATTFYEYFVDTFKVGLQGNEANAIVQDSDGNLVHTADLTQILLHFKNFWNDMAKGCTHLGDKDWKELRESYVIPNHITGDFMDPPEFCDDVIDISNQAGEVLELVELSVKFRKKLVLFLAQHFRVEDEQANDITRRMVHLATAKLEATFRKQ